MRFLSAFLIIGVIGFAAPAAAQQPALSSDSLQKLAAPLPSRLGLTVFASGDTLAQLRALRTLIRDSTLSAVETGEVIRFLSAIAVAHPNASVRLNTIGRLRYWIRGQQLAPAEFVESLGQIVRTAPDSAVLHQAVIVLQSVALRPALDAISDRIRSGGNAASNSASSTITPDWFQNELTAVSDLAENNVRISPFMRVPPSVLEVAPGQQSIRFFGIGDWGSLRERDRQYAVAKAIRDYHARDPFTFGITLGDNFYGFPRPDTPMSERWQLDYENQYGVMGVPVFVALGNHDYDMPDQIAAEYVYGRISKTWRLPATHYTYTAGPAQFFVLDGDPPAPFLLEWLERELARSTATWKVIYTHYPAYLAHRFGAEYTAGSKAYVVPLMKKYGVQLYINGHHHSLQHWEVDGMHFVTSGGGGRETYPLGDTIQLDQRRKFAASALGFSVFDIDAHNLTHKFVAPDGTILDEFTVRR